MVILRSGTVVESRTIYIYLITREMFAYRWENGSSIGSSEKSVLFSIVKRTKFKFYTIDKILQLYIYNGVRFEIYKFSSLLEMKQKYFLLTLQTESK